MNTITMEKTRPSAQAVQLALALIAAVFASLLPQTVGQQFFRLDPVQTLLVRGAVLGLLLLASFAYRPAMVLRRFFAILLTILLADSLLRPVIAASQVWQNLFPATAPGWFAREAGPQVLRLLPSLAAGIALVVMGYRRRDFFLTPGDMNAPAEPVRWLSIKPSDRWMKTGLSFLFMIALITAIIMLMANSAALGKLPRLLPFLPAILIFAALNAFNENFYTRAALLPVLLQGFSKSQALLISALYFSLGHLEFTQMGPTAFLFAGLLGWILGKSMLETRGIAWAWIIQLPNDILAFSFIALAAAGL